MKVKITNQNIAIREAPKAAYDIENDISYIDNTSLCHLGFIDGEFPVVGPMLRWRVGSSICPHAANSGRLAKCCEGKNITQFIAILDGNTLARNAFNHSWKKVASAVGKHIAAIIDNELKNINVANALRAT